MIGDNFLDKFKPKTEQPVEPVINSDLSVDSSSPNKLTAFNGIDKITSIEEDVNSLVNSIESTQIDITSGYDTWLRILFALTDQFGETGRDYAHRISRFHPEYKQADCNKQYDHCLRSTKSGITIRTLFYIAQLHGIMVHKNFSDWSSELSIQLPAFTVLDTPISYLPTQESAINSPHPSISQSPPLPFSIAPSPHPTLALFPVDVFPLPIADFIDLASRSINCPPDFIAVPVLSVLATAIGTSHSILLKKGWTEGPHIFSAVVALPGSKKSPALSAATVPIREIQRSFCLENESLEEEYKLQLSAFNIQAELWKKRKPEEKKPEDQPNPPIEPSLKQIKTSNATIEAIGKLLDQNKRGILFEQDELAAWVKSMNAYRSGKGADLENWLSFWNGSQVVINRASAKKPLILDNPFVNVTGCIQPDLLTDLSGIKQNGFFDRILPSFPDPIPQRYTVDELPDEISEAYSKLVKILFSLQPIIDQDKKEMPVLMHFTLPSRQAWEKWNRIHDAEMNSDELPYYLLGVWSKLQAYMARFILIIQLSQNASKNVFDRLISPDSVEAAAELIIYFKSHIRKVYKELFNSEMDRKVVQAVAWIRRNGGKVTPRMMLNSNVGRCTSSAQINELITEMVERNIGTLTKINPEKGGRPSFSFTLNIPAIELKQV